MDAHHPDLVALDRHVRLQFERVLRAEQAAAEVTRRRTTSLRDRLIDQEELGAVVTIHHGRQVSVGTVVAVGTDHVELSSDGQSLLVPVSSIESVAIR